MKREQENPRNNIKIKKSESRDLSIFGFSFFIKDIISQKIKNGDQREREREMFIFLTSYNNCI